MNTLSGRARLAGLLYLLCSAVGYLRLIYIPNALIVDADAAATARNIAAHEMLFRLGIVSYVLCATGWIFVTLALYRLLKDVHPGLASLMVILGSLMVVPIFFFNAVSDAAALMAVRGEFLSVFDKPHRDGLAMLFLRMHDFGDVVNEIFWGLWLIPFGMLVYRSRFFPKVLGIWLILGCFGYLALSLTGMLWPQYQESVFHYTHPLRVSELGFMLWALIIGAKLRVPQAVSRSDAGG